MAISYGHFIRLWCIQDSGSHSSSEIGIFDMRVHVDALFFIGSQLVSTSSKGKVGVWHAMTQNFQIQVRRELDEKFKAESVSGTP